MLEYFAVVWDNCTIQDSNTLEKLQNEAARIMTGLTLSVCLVNLYRECGCVTLNTRSKNKTKKQTNKKKQKKKNKKKKNKTKKQTNKQTKTGIYV